MVWLLQLLDRKYFKCMTKLQSAMKVALFQIEDFILTNGETHLSNLCMKHCVTNCFGVQKIDLDYQKKR